VRLFFQRELLIPLLIIGRVAQNWPFFDRGAPPEMGA
jgi:hypothetical protein